MSYLTQASIAEDVDMRYRVAACAAQEGCATDGLAPDTWTWEWRQVWASAPGWDAAWESYLANNPEDPRPGADPGVITDGMILGQVQSMKPFKSIGTP